MSRHRKRTRPPLRAVVQDADYYRSIINGDPDDWIVLQIPEPLAAETGIHEIPASLFYGDVLPIRDDDLRAEVVNAMLLGGHPRMSVEAARQASTNRRELRLADPALDQRLAGFAHLWTSEFDNWMLVHVRMEPDPFRFNALPSYRFGNIDGSICGTEDDLLYVAIQDRMLRAGCRIVSSEEFHRYRDAQEPLSENLD